VTEVASKENNMKAFKPCMFLLVVVVVGALAGCSTASTHAANVSDSIRSSLDKAGFKDVSASQDRDKGVVTLTGHVAADADKAQAESIAKSIAADEVISNQIAVLPAGSESEAKQMNSDLDKGIESNLDATLISEKLHDAVKFSVKNHVVTLTGNVNSEAARARAESVASAVPNVQQVVNELQVKAQKATSTE
jgi:hyperosmotically inducible periplasmic protein